MFISEYFGLDDDQYQKFNDMGIFDAFVDKDSYYFINIIRLKESTVPEFIDAYVHFNGFFSELATLLELADSPTVKDKMYRTARNKCSFNEVNGINLGFSTSTYGSGWGEKLTNQFLQDAYQIVKKGCKKPEIFHLVALFEEGIAGDRVSDMIATIIEPDIRKYTLRIMTELGMTREHNSNLMFREDGLIQNPYKDAPILLLPIEILHELPVAKDWYDIENVVFENEIIRQEINAEINNVWKKWGSSDRKRYLLTNIFMKPEVCDRVIEGFKEAELDILNINEDPDYFAELLLRRTKEIFEVKAPDDWKKQQSSLEAAMVVINIFKDWVENNRGWAEIQNVPTKRREKAVQRYVHLGAKYYIDVNNLDISFEPDEGRGPVDIKISRGTDKTLAEIKLSSNDEYLHGYQVQVKEYGKAERTRNLIYVLVDVGNPRRVKNIKDIQQINKMKGIECPELVIVDAREKQSASIYELDAEDEDTEYDFGNFPDMDLNIVE